MELGLFVVNMLHTVNQLIFTAVYFRIFVFSDIFATINFRGL